VRLLLDTHVLIWAVTEPGCLREGVREAVIAPANTVFVSAATAWEIAIKVALGRLRFPLDRFEAVLADAGLDHLPITAAHGIAAGGLPHHHADPFDRMLVAQAQLEDLVLVSEDRAFPPYAVRLFGREKGT
jgi:PIN domain nuclease of toxin-antitoxin system